MSMSGFPALIIRIPWPLGVYLGMSVVTFLFYFLDKSRAIRGQWRIPESTLHLCELLGGFPGAIVAQQVFRHKSRKAGYQLVFWLIVLIHGLFWGWYFGLIRS